MDRKGEALSIRVQEPGEIPAETARVARAAFPAGSLAIRIRDELGPLFRDEQFADLFPAKGKPAFSPGRLALVLVLQFVEALTDRQAAEAVRARIDFKYALALSLEDPGFDFSILSEFRSRLLTADGGQRVFDAILQAAAQRGLLKTSGRARTDSTHVHSAARALTHLELLIETLRAALDQTARVAPDWLAQVAEPEWFEHYSRRPDQQRLPRSRANRTQMAERVGRDGTRLLALIDESCAPAELRTLPAVETLRTVWRQQFETADGRLCLTSPEARPPGAERLVTPHDIEARGSVKRDTLWNGYKVHLTETCDPDAPHLLTDVVTTVATVPDTAMTETVHARLAERGRLPAEHLVDAGYVDAHLIVHSREVYGLQLTGPAKASTSPQTTAAAGFALDDFTIDWDNQQVTCPGGKTTRRWQADHSQHGTEVIRVRFSKGDCRPCSLREHCTASTVGRSLTVRPREEHQALRQARAEQETDDWKQRYKARAGIEGTISQAVLHCGLRRSRYRGLAKTALQHQLTGAAINLLRIDAHLIGTPLASTRTSPFEALRPAGT